MIRKSKHHQKKILLLLGQPYHEEIILGFAKISQAYKWNLGMVKTNNPENINIHLWDGVVVHASDSPWREWAASLPCPVVNVSRKDKEPEIPTVSVDNYAIGALAADHFLLKGFTSFAFLGFPDFYFSLARQQGFADRLEEHGFSLHLLAQKAFASDPRHVSPSGPIAQSYHFLRHAPKPIAVFAATDELAYSLSSYCTREEIPVPSEIAILGCNNETVFCNLGFPPRSSVDPASFAVGQEAAHLLRRLLAKDPVPKTLIEVSPTEVVQRLSTDTLAVADPHLARALHFLQENLRTPLTVSELARIAGVSRRSLETACRRFFQKSPLQLIHELRLDRARHLLIHSHYSMARIAEECGLATSEYFSQLFRKKFKSTPSAYRRKFSRLER